MGWDWEEMADKKQNELDNAQQNQEWDEDADLRYKGVLPQVNLSEQEKELKHQVHLKHKDKTRERY